MPRVAHGQRPRVFKNALMVKLIEGVRSFRSPDQPLTDEEKTHWLEIALSYTYILAGILFVIGSFLFFPWACCYTAGVYCYLVGGFFYMQTSVFDLEEALNSKARWQEVAMCYTYVGGTTLYIVGTFFYFPRIEEWIGIITSESLGSWFFIGGSTAFVFACFLNGAHAGDAFYPDLNNKKEDCARVKLAKLMTLATSEATMFGALLFLVGSVLYLPNIGCTERTVVLGTWAYLIGSVFFTFAGILPICQRVFARSIKKKSQELKNNNSEKSPRDDSHTLSEKEFGLSS